MNQKELSELTNEELLEVAKKHKSASIWSALVIGFMIGIVIFSVASNSVGFFTLIPLYFVYRMVSANKNNQGEELEELLKERGLK